ncbi:MAG: RodZ domain-containing protein [Myxococcota bacterium]
MIDLRTERERKGLDTGEVSRSAGIPERYIIALESGDTATLPDGPFRRGYLKQYLEFLGFDPEYVLDDVSVPLEPTVEPEQTETGTLTYALEEVPLGRLVVAGFVLTMTVVLGLRVIGEFVFAQTGIAASDIADVDPAVDEEDPTASITAPETLPTARLRIRAIESTRLKTKVDGVESFSGVLPAREVIDLQGSEALEVWAADLTTIRITYNGERIEPLGNLSEDRRLVFLQD